MDTVPPEILIYILSNLKFDEKHVVRRVSHLWKEAADIAIAQQHRLIVYPDDLTVSHQTLSTYCGRIPYNSEVNGIRVDRLLFAMRLNKLSVLSGIRELNLEAAIMSQWDEERDDENDDPPEKPDLTTHKIWKMLTASVNVLIPSIWVPGPDEDTEREKRIPCLFKSDEAASLLKQVASNLTNLIIRRSTVLDGIAFPSLKAYECTDSVYEGNDYLLFPVLEDLTLAFADEVVIEDLTDAHGDRLHQINKLVIENYFVPDEEVESDPLPDALKRMINLTHVDIAIYYPNLPHDLFEHLHHLVIVKLGAMLPGDYWVSDHFSDAGVQILLKNNHNLQEVSLYGFELTDSSLMYFADYVTSHGLRKLSLISNGRFSEAAENILRDAGEHKLQELHIADAETQSPDDDESYDVDMILTESDISDEDE